MLSDISKEEDPTSGPRERLQVTLWSCCDKRPNHRFGEMYLQLNQYWIIFLHRKDPPSYKRLCINPSKYIYRLIRYIHFIPSQRLHWVVCPHVKPAFWAPWVLHGIVAQVMHTLKQSLAEECQSEVPESSFPRTALLPWKQIPGVTWVPVDPVWCAKCIRKRTILIHVGGKGCWNFLGYIHGMISCSVMQLAFFIGFAWFDRLNRLVNWAD